MTASTPHRQPELAGQPDHLEPTRLRQHPHPETPPTLTEPAPRSLGVLDQLGFWGNLGVTLLGFAAALSVLAPAGMPPLGLPAAAVAVVVGTLLGSLVLGVSLAIGARTGAPGMVLLRGLLGARASAVPTVLNLAQCLGWAVFELVVIAQGLDALTHRALPHELYVGLAGAVTIALTMRPLGAIRILRRYVSALVLLAVVILAVDLLRHGIPTTATGSWRGFWPGVDAAIAVAISWVPLGADYSRHSRTEGAAFLGGFAGFATAQIACLLMGLVALAQVAQDPDRIFDLFLTLPLGTLAFAILVVREADESFANVFSTAVSVQNLAPHWDRRILSAGIGTLATLLALTIDIGQYTSFLYLLGGVFIPLSGALIGAWIAMRGHGWDTSRTAPLRPGMLTAWAAGFVVYQLVNPGALGVWSTWWGRAGEALHTSGQPWLSASVGAFVIAASIAWSIAWLRSRRPRVTPPGRV